MKTNIRKSLSVLLSVLMALSVFGGLTLTSSAAAPEPEDGALVTFGSYPQSLVTDETLKTELNSLAESWTDSDWTYYDYYVGNAHEDFMKYADVTVDGNKYRAVTFSHYRPYKNTGTTTYSGDSFQDDNGYVPNTVYWFRYEPVVWRVLDNACGLIMTESILDSQAFNKGLYESGGEYYGDAELTHYAINWAYSSLREWMNNDFLNTAFSSGEQSYIKDSPLFTWSSSNNTYDADNTTDKVFPLAWEDAQSSLYGFSSDTDGGESANRTAFGTDYAKCQGLEVNGTTGEFCSGASRWHLRTPWFGESTYLVSFDGWIGQNYTCYTNAGVRPALNIDLRSAISQSAITSYNNGDLVEFGSYPQTRVPDGTLKDELDSLIPTLTWTYYDYYVNYAHEDFMKYADVTYDGNKYRAVTFSHYRPFITTTASTDIYYTYQDDNGYDPDTVYWFRYEPIVWRILDVRAGLMMTWSIVDCQMFNNSYYAAFRDTYGDADHTYYASDWAHSSLRAWMNGDFLNAAFDSGAQSYIKISSLVTPTSAPDPAYDAGPTTDRIFPLSRADALNTAYGFSSDQDSSESANRTAFGTDYAKCQGLYTDRSTGKYYSGASWWCLRTPRYSCENGVVWDDGKVHDIYNTEGIIGVRPALKIDLRSAISQSAVRLYHDYGALVPEAPATCTDDGTIAHYVCSICGAYFDADKNPVADIAIPAGHTYGEDDWTAPVAADCGNDGSAGYFTCTGCQERFDAQGNQLADDDIIIHATGDHTTGLVGVKEATATEDGYTGDLVCTTCGKTIEYGEVIPATGEKEEKPDFGPCPMCGKIHNGDAADRLLGALHSLIHWFIALQEYFASL